MRRHRALFSPKNRAAKHLKPKRFGYILGLSAIILQSAKLFTLIKYIGAAYLLYLGIKTIIASFKRTNLESRTSGHNKTSRKKAFHLNFFEGFLTQLLNPKVSMFYVAAFPQFLNFSTTSYADAFLLVSIHATIIFTWFLGLSIFFERIKKTVKKSGFGVWVQRFSGGILVYFGSLLAMQRSS